MYKPQEISIRNFYGGISDDPRKFDLSQFQISKHFDIFSQPNRLIPYRSLEADTNDGSTATGMKQYFVRDFKYHSASAKLFGLGQTGAGLTKIVYKADATTGNWTLPASSEGNGAVKNGCFLEYKGKMLGFQGTNQIFSWDIATTTITNSLSTVASTITSVADGIIAADGNAYIAYNNVIVRINTTFTVTDIAKTVPDTYKITSICNYGSFMAIAAAPIANFNGTSKVFIWNLSSDLFYETIDWGEGEIRILDTIEGGLLAGITDRYLNNSVGAGKGSMIVQVYSGGAPQVVKEVFTKALTGKSIPTAKAVKANRLSWSAKIMTNSSGTEYLEGIWSFGKTKGGVYALSLDIIDENVDTDGIEGFSTAGDYFFIAHSGDGSIDKTNDASTYAFTSVYESQILDFGNPTLTKGIDMISIYTAPFPSSGSVTVKIKCDDDTSFTTIGSLSTQGEVSRDFYNIESTGAEFPSFKEIIVRLESITGGAEITGFHIKVQPYIGSIN